MKHLFRRDIPQLNTTSTADISFMLLIFFLVTTSMDIDKGITKMLPPIEQQTQETIEIEKNKQLNIKITPQNNVEINGKKTTIKSIKQIIAKFLTYTGADHLITITCAPTAKYNIYFHVQNALLEAYNTQREQYAIKYYKKHFQQCSITIQDKIKKTCPKHVAEDYSLSDNTTNN